MNAAPILPSLPNFRDLGGYETRDGRRVRHGAFYRSPAPLNLPEADQARLLALDPALVVDFRGEHEAEQSPAAGLPGPLLARRLSLPVEPRTAEAIARARGDGPLTPAAAETVMVESYRAYVSAHFRTFAEFLRRVGRVESGAVVFHCTAGKDRTGFAAALILTALGVPEETILADYLATARLWQPDPRLEARVPPPARPAFFGVAPRYLEAAFAELRARHGSAELFVRDALGGRSAHAEWVARRTEPA